MLLTIIIPSLGRKSVHKAIQSVEDQTIPTTSITIVDWRREGAGPTRNKLIQLVETPWVAFCDDDDWLHPKYHEWLKEEKENNDMVIFRMKVAPNDADSKPIIKDVGQLKVNDVGISFALKTRIAKNHPFKNMLCEDYDLIQGLYKEGYKIKISDHIAYYVGGVE